MLSSLEIAAIIPDVPRWIEPRDLLLADACKIFGLQEDPELSFVLRDKDKDSVFVIGTPQMSAVHAAVAGFKHGGSVIAPIESGDWLARVLPTWTRTRIILHSLQYPERVPSVFDDAVDFLDPNSLNDLLIDSELLDELKSGAAHSCIAATFVNQQPVAFCYVSSETETLWDVAIDTLPEHQRRGYAARAFAHMYRHQQTLGKQPVWAAVEENPASWRLAQKIGFVAVDELALFELK